MQYHLLANDWVWRHHHTSQLKHLDLQLLQQHVLDNIHPHHHTDDHLIKQLVTAFHCPIQLLSIRLMAFGLNRFFRSCFSQIFVGFQQDDLKTIQHQSIVFVPAHKSHLDYLILSYVCYAFDLPIPMIAAGENLNLPIIGNFLKNCGAFFIKRSFKGGPDSQLYKKVFSEWITALIQQGHTIEFFPEGGRSRTGRLLPLKKGILKTICQAFENHMMREDVHFVPVDIAYDVPYQAELKSYVEQRLGKPKAQESVSGLLQTLLMGGGILNSTPLSSVTITFGKPISLRQDIVETSNDDDTLSSLVSRLSFEMQSISKITVTAVLSASYLTLSKYQKEREPTWPQVQTLAYDVSQYLKHSLAESLAFKPDIANLSEIAKLIKIVEDDKDALIHPISVERELEVGYLKNQLLGHIYAECFLCIAIKASIDGKPVYGKLIEEATLLKNHLQSEIPFYDSINLDEGLNRLIEARIICKDTLHVLDWSMCNFFCGMVAPLLETCWVVRYYSYTKHSFDANDVQAFARSCLSSGRIRSSETLCVPTLTSLYKGVLEISEQDSFQFLNLVECALEIEDPVLSNLE